MKIPFMRREIDGCTPKETPSTGGNIDEMTDRCNAIVRYCRPREKSDDKYSMTVSTPTESRERRREERKSLKDFHAASYRLDDDPLQLSQMREKAASDTLRPWSRRKSSKREEEDEEEEAPPSRGRRLEAVPADDARRRREDSEWPETTSEMANGE